ncbi:hypothetical protein Efla_000678 [Eimeria flavescens]
MRPGVCVFGGWALLVVALVSPSAVSFASASWTLKRLAGSQWRNGNRLIAEALGRTPSEIKSLMAGTSPEFQEQYKQLAERFADCDEAKRKSTSPTETAALDEHMRHLRMQAEAILSGLLGPSGATAARVQQQQQLSAAGMAPYGLPAGEAAAAGGPGELRQPSDVVLDPLQQQMLLLQQRQQQQLQQMVQQMQQAQQQERARVEHQLREAREQHLALQRESQTIRSYLISLQAEMQTIQQRVKQLAGYEQTIEETTGRLESFMRVLEENDAEGEAGLPQPAHLQAADPGVYVQLKMNLGQLLAAVNHGLQAVLAGVDKAEERASALADMGPSGKQLSEQLLQMCASFRVTVSSQEEFLSEVVSVLEAKQVRCDAALERLKAALDAAYSRFAGALKGTVLQHTQELSLKAEELRGAIALGAQQLKEQFDAAAASPEHVQQLQQYTSNWVSMVDQSLAAFESLYFEGQRLVAAAAALPAEHAVDVAQLQRSLHAANEMKREVRQHKARVQQQLRMLEARLQQAQQQRQQQQQQLLLEQQRPSFPGASVPDPYAAYTMPTVLQPQQQQAAERAPSPKGLGGPAALPQMGAAFGPQGPPSLQQGFNPQMGGLGGLGGQV